MTQRLFLMIAFGLSAAFLTPSATVAEERVHVEFPPSGPPGPCLSSWTTDAGGTRVTLRGGRFIGDKFEADDGCYWNWKAIPISFDRPVKNIRFRVYGQYGIPTASGGGAVVVSSASTGWMVEIPGPTRSINAFLDRSIGNYWYLWVWDLSFVPVEASETRVWIRTSTPGSDPRRVVKSAAGGEITAQIAMGTLFDIGLETSDGSPVSARLELGSAASGTAEVDPALNDRSVLLPDHPLLRFNATAAPVVQSTFVTLHLGYSKIRLVPEGSRPPVDVRVNVIWPTRLGDRETFWDPLISYYAHYRGIPPQWIKGHIDQEAGLDSNGRWDPMSYRYEPLGSDLNGISARSVWRTGPNISIGRLPYSRYRFPAKGSDEGPPYGDLLDIEIEQRNRYLTERDGTPRRLTNDDRDVTAREIFDANDAVQNWSAHSRPAAERVHAALSGEIDLLDFNAQTAVAASWGLMQMLHATAIEPIHWKNWHQDPNPTPISPSFLWETFENIVRDDGSVSVATTWMASLFSDVNNGLSMENPVLSGYGEFLDAYQRALGEYNLRRSYPAEVVQRFVNFAPVQDEPIFP